MFYSSKFKQTQGQTVISDCSDSHDYFASIASGPVSTMVKILHSLVYQHGSVLGIIEMTNFNSSKYPSWSWIPQIVYYIQIVCEGGGGE